MRILIIVAMLLSFLGLPQIVQTHDSSSKINQYYLALGDSLAYGYQPDGNENSGYVNDYFSYLEKKGIDKMVNYGCYGETSQEMIAQSGCPSYVHNPYSGTMLDAAVSFIKSHKNEVRVVTVDIGANDFWSSIKSPSTCSIDNAEYIKSLSGFDSNFKDVILPQLKNALGNSGSIFVLNYPFPYQDFCQSLVSYAKEFNYHISSDASVYKIPVADVWSAFGSNNTPDDKICSYTWICSNYYDIHFTTEGYLAAAKAIEAQDIILTPPRSAYSNL